MCESNNDLVRIVERLREYSRNMGGPPEDYLAWQAADEIERLRAENKIIAKMHEPQFAEMKQRLDANINWPGKAEAADEIERLQVALQQIVDRYPDHEDMLDIARNTLAGRTEEPTS